MTEYVYRLLDGEGQDASGYNNSGGLYKTRGGAKIRKGQAERNDARWNQDQGPYKIQRTRVVWEDVPVD